MSEGVEWAAHACALLAVAPAERGLSATALADYHALPRAYMAKHLQALARAGVVTSARGAGGGYRLARPADQVTLWDIASAIEGAAPSFRCNEIRRQGPCATPPEQCAAACPIAAAFHAAERAQREVLRGVTVAHIVASVAAGMTPERMVRFATWLETGG